MPTGKEFMLALRVLGYRDEGQWAAHCLETDLVGYGDTFDAALKELSELTEMQVSFAFHKNQPSLLDCPAPTGIIEAYNASLRSVLQNFTVEKKPDKERQIASIPWPSCSKGNDSFVQAQAI